MLRWVVWMGIVCVMPLAQADIVCRDKTTGQVYQTQSGGVAGTCFRSFSPDQVEELLVTPSERHAMIAAWDANPANPHVVTQRARQDERDALKSKLKGLGLTDEQADQLVQ